MSDRLFALPIDQRLSPTVSRRMVGRIPLVVVDHPAVRAAVSLQGAQLIAWQPVGTTNSVVWLSEETAWTPGVALRGGIPICWPWFANAGSPAHGFARISMWELAHIEDNGDGVDLTFTLHSTPETLEMWPHEFALSARIRVGPTCTVEIEATGDHRSTGALHTYLGVGAADQTRITGLGTDFVDKVHVGTRGHQDGPLVPAEHTDRIYTHPDAVSLVEDGRLGRVVEVRHHHHSDVVVWNPGSELSASMTDLADDAYRGFVCVETARISRPMTADPARPALLGTTLRITQ